MGRLGIGVEGWLPWGVLTEEGSLCYMPTLALGSYCYWRALPLLRIFYSTPRSPFDLWFLTGLIPIGKSFEGTSFFFLRVQSYGGGF